MPWRFLLEYEDGTTRWCYLQGAGGLIGAGRQHSPPSGEADRAGARAMARRLLRRHQRGTQELLELVDWRAAPADRFRPCEAVGVLEVEWEDYAIGDKWEWFRAASALADWCKGHRYVTEERDGELGVRGIKPMTAWTPLTQWLWVGEWHNRMEFLDQNPGLLRLGEKRQHELFEEVE